MAASAFPVLSLYSSSMNELHFSQILLPLSMSLAGGLMVYLIFSSAMRSFQKGCFISICFIQLFFAYNVIVPGKLEEFAVWKDVVYEGLFILLAILAIYALVSSRSMDTASQVATIYAICILCVPIGQIAWRQTQSLIVVAANPSSRRASPVATPPGTITPDIYHILLDGYSRGDVLKGIYGIDNTPFLNALKERGFYIAEESRSNYLQTLLSITSTLNFAYLDSLKGPTSSAYLYRRYLGRQCLNNNAVLRELRPRGYFFVFFTSSLGELNKDITADVELSPAAGTFSAIQLELMDALLSCTPLRSKIFVKLWLLGSSEPNVLFQFRSLRQFKPQKAPKFVFVHVLCPHPPFQFDRNGNFNPLVGFNMGDGSDFPGTYQQYIRGYSEQVLFLNWQILQTIDAILRNYPPEKRPVIIMHGDHGGGSHYNQSGIKSSLIWERASILNAYLLPEGRRFDLYESITPVNTYRVLFNGLFKTNFKLLPDRTYFASKLEPYVQRLLSEDVLTKPVLPTAGILGRPPRSDGHLIHH